MNLIEKAAKILEEPVCDHCLGRQFAMLLSGYTNSERGRMIRNIIAMTIDSKNININNLEMSNFHNYKFHDEELADIKINKKKCAICNDIFDKLDVYVKEIEKNAKKIEFKTFLIGTQLPFELIEKEEKLWERVGIEYCEPLKAELNREIGKLVEKRLKVKFNSKRPDVNFVIDIGRKKVKMEIMPLFIYGEYQKLIRGIPQTKWPSGKYKTSVEQIIAKPFLSALLAKSQKFHGSGREDIDARCLAWRPFVLEILAPKKRFINRQLLKKIAKKIPKNKIRVRNLRISDINEVRKLKEERNDKVYRAVVVCDKKIKKDDLKKLQSLVGKIKQKTPQRVLHRRADKIRDRNLISIKSKFINNNKFIIEVRCNAGLYVKELISGDNGRTKPSVSELLGTNCKCIELDVIKIIKG